VVSVERNNAGTWVSLPGAPANHCAGDTFGQAAGSTSGVDVSASCNLVLASGTYRIKGNTGMYGGTTLNFYSGRYFVTAK
jgi:hypothetical protein